MNYSTQNVAVKRKKLSYKLTRIGARFFQKIEWLMWPVGKLLVSHLWTKLRYGQIKGKRKDDNNHYNKEKKWKKLSAPLKSLFDTIFNHRLFFLKKNVNMAMPSINFQVSTSPKLHS